MKTFLLTGLFCLLSASCIAQETFKITDASRYFDIKISVAKCDKYGCDGKASYSFYKKGSNTPYKVINVEDTYVSLHNGGKPIINQTLLYSQQSAVKVDDFNFDKVEDVAVCNGNNGSYGAASFAVYLSSRSAVKFIYSKSFSELAEHNGMFEIDKKRKILRVFDKSGCCRRIMEDYSVVNNRPFKVLSEEQDIGDDAAKTKITTKRLVKGKWKTTVKYMK